MDNQTRKNWHRQDILAAIRKCKGSLAALSVEHGLASGTLANALVKPWPKGELIIALALGTTPQEIWPERYFDEQGQVKKWPVFKSKQPAEQNR
ncbi:transcriptional regulator [Erwinia sp. E602]|uniref:helix-turn-helix domain-containing protein n=1 Tax=Erwinia sp. E602 TaxID=2675378 RepID=UPI001BA71416|nr:helix-turn-helix transcriptional regulator [Erwinia sp. E602]QUG74969.1 transcriptional regulator [Erwinia sp. E602]